MSNGWDWIEEGQRIKGQVREIAGLMEGVRSESIVFESELDTLRRENARLRDQLAKAYASKRTSLEELYRHYEEGV
ncbi:hypothetical protein [Streptomyces sp. NPDC055036]